MVTVQVAIEVRAIGQRTRSGEVTLRDISLTVGHGELVAIIGGSGSGKTTLLDAMSGLRPPSSGAVRRIHRNIGYVANGETIHGILPLARALRYRAALRGMPASQGAAEEALRIAGLAGGRHARETGDTERFLRRALAGGHAAQRRPVTERPGQRQDAVNCLAVGDISDISVYAADG